jgi:hypothetical protein
MARPKNKPRRWNAIVLARCYGICRYEATLLSLLLEKPSVLPDDLERHWKFASNPKVVIWRLRAKLGHRIPIRSQRNLGYWIEPAHKQRAIQFIEPRAAA